MPLSRLIALSVKPCRWAMRKMRSCVVFVQCGISLSVAMITQCPLVIVSSMEGANRGDAVTIGAAVVAIMADLAERTAAPGAGAGDEADALGACQAVGG